MIIPKTVAITSPVEETVSAFFGAGPAFAVHCLNYILCVLPFKNKYLLTAQYSILFSTHSNDCYITTAHSKWLKLFLSNCQQMNNSLAFIYECCYLHAEVGNFSDHLRIYIKITSNNLTNFIIIFKQNYWGYHTFVFSPITCGEIEHLFVCDIRQNRVKLVEN